MRSYTFLVLLFICFFANFAFAANGDLGAGTDPNTDGSADRPYLIEDFNDFQAFCDDPNYWASGVYTRLDCDLDLDPNLTDRMIYSQAPIAGSNSSLDYDGIAYAGSFDGNGHIIHNLTVNGENFCALFGMTSCGSSITNLGLENASIRGTGFVATLVGGSGSITNCHSTGVVNGDYYVGGLVGYNGVSITSSYSTAEVTSSGNYVGGLAGENRGSISNSFAAGTVTGNDYVGGLVGENGTGGNIISSYSTGAVTGDDYVGGLVGYNRGGSITTSYSAGLVTSSGGFVGGLAGYNKKGNISRSLWDVETCGLDVAYINYYNYYGDEPVYSAFRIAEGKTTLEMQTESTFTDAGWDFVGEAANGTHQTWQMPVGGGYPVLSVFNGYEPIVLSGDGSEENPYLIGDVNDLGAVIYYDNRAYYKLIADVNLAEIEWQRTIIPDFAGHFDGDGYVISNINISGSSYVGLFGKLLNGAEVANIGLENVRIIGSGDYVAGLAGYSDGNSITNCYSTGEVEGEDYIGGLVGYNVKGDIIRSYSAVNISDSVDYVGGLVGRNDNGIVNSSYSTGDVCGCGCIGGLVGYNVNGSITNSYSTVGVYGDDYVGGLVGRNDNGSITNSYSTRDVSGYGNIGGLVGRNDNGSITGSYSAGDVGGDSEIGSLVGYNRGSITSSYSTGDVYCGSEYVGGLVGYHYSGSISSCYSAGVVTGSYYVGGLVGVNKASISESFFTGEVTGNDYIGGLVGYNYNDIISSYSTGAVINSLGQCAGGLVGYNKEGNITGSYSTGVVNGDSDVGGLVGSNDDGSITTSYSTCVVTGVWNVAGLVGINSGSITSSFWDVEASGMVDGVGSEEPDPNGVTGKATAEMQMLSTFVDAGWDFVGESINGANDVWRMCEDGVSYPKLWWEFEAGDFVCGDGVDFIDFAILSDTWMLSAGQDGYNDRCDLSGDEAIGFADLAIFCDNWLEGI